jgi:hypothetical protein
MVPGSADYCREIEAYLCRKNEGHLIRIVGPSFELVCGWAQRGVPLKVAFRGIDRYVERYYAKGPRRRPVRIDFCEADVLDVFDEWRRAVGVSGPAVTVGADGDEGEAEGPGRRRSSLPAHLDRAIARLTALRAGDGRDLDAVLDWLVSELDRARARAKGLRGGARAEVLAQLARLDVRLLDAARASLTADTLAALGREAEGELAPFRARMPRDAYEQSLAACRDRLLREHARLPVLTLE